MAMLTIWRSVLCVMIMEFVSCNAEMSFPALDHIKSSVDGSMQAATVQAMVYRVLPEHAANVMIKVDSSIGPQFKDTFMLYSMDGKLSITGSSGIAAAWGLYYYLSQYCNASISWAGNQMNIPKVFPELPKAGVKVTSNDRFRYYQNVCTVSYSFVWWTWERWEREIDWMAMNAINLPLAFNGQEEIWRRVYTKMGFTEDEMGKHFGGPAFLAWSRMGNIHGWGGPLRTSWHEQQVLLQHKILTRMRAFGMIPVLPGFAGHVPETFQRVFPNASVSTLSWGGFNNSYNPTTLLDVTDPLFSKIGEAFIKEYSQEFGTDHVYNADTFNEMTPKSNDTKYLASAGKAVYSGMTAGDPQAIWLMQGWLFQSNFWQPEQAKALLTSIPQGKMIVLDLYSEVSPQYSRLDTYYGQPFIWCMLHNFGGTVGMYGVIDNVNEQPFKGREYPKSTMIGTGLTPEGINQNDVMYEFMMENTWRTSPRNLTQWFDNYAVRRYGKEVPAVKEAWRLLMRSVYNCTIPGYKDHGKTDLVVIRPRLLHQIKPVMWYEPEDVFKAWDYMLNATSDEYLMNHPLFRYDLADVTRQSLQISAIQFYNSMIMYYKKKEVNPVLICNTALMFLYGCMENVLGADSHFLLGRWVDSAKSWATTDEEATWLEFNARNQVTLWGPSGEIRDYANKQWSGLMKGYYQPRWNLFNEMLVDALKNGTEFNQTEYNVRAFTEIEQPFTMDTTPLPREPTGDLLAAVKDAHVRFRPHSAKQKKFFSGLKSASNAGVRSGHHYISHEQQVVQHSLDGADDFSAEFYQRMKVDEQKKFIRL